MSTLLKEGGFAGRRKSGRRTWVIQHGVVQAEALEELVGMPSGIVRRVPAQALRVAVAIFGLRRVGDQVFEVARSCWHGGVPLFRRLPSISYRPGGAHRLSVR